MVDFNKKLYTFTRKHVQDLLTYDVKKRALYSKEEHLKLLLTASLVNGFAEGVSRSMADSPTGETLLSYIKSQEQERLHRIFDSIIEKNVRALRKHRELVLKVPIAIDWHDVMYYGDPETPMVIGTQHKKGSNYAYEYLTASILMDGERLVIAVLPITAKSEVGDLTIGILLRLEHLGIRIRYVTLDGGFFNVEIIRFLEAYGVKYIIHLPMTSKTKKMKLWKGRRFVYTGRKREWKRRVSFNVIVAYDKRKKYKYLFATNMPYKDDTILHMFNKRWGIETSYRMCNQFLIKTTSKSYTVRFFYYLLACIVYNTWVLYNHNKDERCAVVQMKICLIGFITNELKESPT